MAKNHDQFVGLALYSYRCLCRLGPDVAVRFVRSRGRLLTRSDLTSIENGSCNPSMRVVNYLAQCYGISRGKLFQTAEEMRRTANRN